MGRWEEGGVGREREGEKRKRWRKGCSYCIIRRDRGVAGVQRLTTYVRMRGNWKIEVHLKSNPLGINPTGLRQMSPKDKHRSQC